MAAAYRVKYLGPRGQECPDAVVTFPAGEEEDVVAVAPKIKETLERDRSFAEQPWRVTIREIVYLGPWFAGR